MITEDMYTITPYSIGAWMVEKDGAEGADVVDITERTCTCRDFNFRSLTKPACKHLKMVWLHADDKEQVRVKRLFDTSTRIEEIKGSAGKNCFSVD